MTKPTFIAAIKEATLLQNAFTGDKKRVLAMWDVLYNKFAHERDEDVLHALDVLGDLNPASDPINSANIRRYVDESRASREWGKRKPEPKPEMAASPAPEYEDMPDETKKAIDKFRDKWKW